MTKYISDVVVSPTKSKEEFEPLEGITLKRFFENLDNLGNFEFTMNSLALAIHLDDFIVIDPIGSGVEDLFNKIIRNFTLK